MLWKSCGNSIDFQVHVSHLILDTSTEDRLYHCHRLNKFDNHLKCKNGSIEAVSDKEPSPLQGKMLPLIAIWFRTWKIHLFRSDKVLARADIVTNILICLSTPRFLQPGEKLPATFLITEMAEIYFSLAPASPVSKRHLHRQVHTNYSRTSTSYVIRSVRKNQRIK